MTLEDFGNVANILTAMTALLAVVFAGYQTLKYRKQRVEAVARDHYQDFLRLSFEHPEFSGAGEARIDVVNRTFDGEQEKFSQYEWFVWAGLNALEALFFALGGRKSWRATIASILDDHKTYLRSSRLNLHADTLEPEFRTFLRPWIDPDQRVSPGA